MAKGSLSLLNQKLGHNWVRDKTFETGSVPEYPRYTVAKMDNGIPCGAFHGSPISISTCRFPQCSVCHLTGNLGGSFRTAARAFLPKASWEAMKLLSGVIIYLTCCEHFVG